MVPPRAGVEPSSFTGDARFPQRCSRQFFGPSPAEVDELLSRPVNTSDCIIGRVGSEGCGGDGDFRGHADAVGPGEKRCRDLDRDERPFEDERGLPPQHGVPRSTALVYGEPGGDVSVAECETLTHEAPRARVGAIDGSFMTQGDVEIFVARHFSNAGVRFEIQYIMTNDHAGEIWVQQGTFSHFQHDAYGSRTAVVSYPPQRGRARIYELLEICDEIRVLSLEVLN